MLEKENTNEHVEPHAQIDEGNILNFLYNLLPHTFSQVERMGGVLFVIFFVAIPFINSTP
jgi:SNF family Na+-dependent transporter